MTGKGLKGDWWVGAWHSLNWPTSAAYALVQRVVHRMSGCAGCRMPDWGFVKEKLHFHAFGAAWASVEPHKRRRMCWELKRCKRCKMQDASCKTRAMWKMHKIASHQERKIRFVALKVFIFVRLVELLRLATLCACVVVCVWANFCIEESVMCHKKKWDTFDAYGSSCAISKSRRNMNLRRKKCFK